MKNSYPVNLANHPFFHGLKPEHLKILAECATEVEFKPGEMIFCEDEPANRFFLIETGRVALEAHQLADGTMPIQEIGAGDVLGWSWLYPPFVWHFRARAIEPTRAIGLNGAHLLCAAERDHEFGYELLKRVSQILIHRLQATRHQLLRQGCPTAVA